MEPEPVVILPTEEAERFRKTLTSAATKARALIYQEAPTSFAAFCRAVIKDERTQLRIIPAPIHLEWFMHVDRCREQGFWPGILAIPESGKSQIFGVGLPLYEIGRDPTTRCGIVGSDEGMSKKRVKPAKDYVQRDPDYRVIFPDALPDQPDKWTEKEFSVRRPGGLKDPSVAAYGIQSPPRGARIDLMICDDICTIKNTIMEPAMRPKIIDLFYEGFDDRLNPDSFVVYIGGIVHNQDLSSRLLRDPRFWFIKQSVSADFKHIVQEDMRTGETKRLPLWDHSWTEEFLRKKHEANPRAFARAYRHVGYDDSERTFSEESVQRAITYVPNPETVPSGAVTVLGFDLAEKRRRGSAIVVVSQEGATRRIHEVLVGKWSGSKKASELIRMRQKYNTLVEIVENNAMQDSIIDLIRVVTGNRVNIHPFTTGKQKADEELGIPGVAAEFEAGRWEILFSIEHRIGMGCDCGRCLLLTQLSEHPFGDADAVMALWFARSGLVKFGAVPDMEWVEPKTRRGGGLERGEKSRLQRFRDLRKPKGGRR